MLTKTIYFTIPLLLLDIFFLGYQAERKVVFEQEHIEMLRVLTGIQQISIASCRTTEMAIQKQCDSYKNAKTEQLRADAAAGVRITQCLMTERNSDQNKLFLDTLAAMVHPDSLAAFDFVFKSLKALRTLDNSKDSLAQKVVDMSCQLQALHIRSLVLEDLLKHVKRQELRVDSAFIVVSHPERKYRRGDTWAGDIFLAHYKSEDPIEVTQ
jgi:hypothetical protein